MKPTELNEKHGLKSTGDTSTDVYYLIILFLLENQGIPPSLQELAEALTMMEGGPISELSKANVRYHIEKLQKLGLIKKVSRKAVAPGVWKPDDEEITRKVYEEITQRGQSRLVEPESNI